MAVNDKNIAGDNFWLNLAAESLYNTFEKRSKAVEQLSALIGWAFGTLSLGGIFSVFGVVKDMDSDTINNLGTSYYILIFAYVLSALARMPVKVDFNPLNMLDIQRVYKDAVKRQTLLFSLALITTIFGFIFFANAVLNEFKSINKKNERKRIEVLKQSMDSTASIKILASVRFFSDTNYLPIVIDTKKSSIFNLEISTDTVKHIYLLKKPFSTDLNGKFYGSFTIPSASQYVFIKATIRYQEEGLNYIETSKIKILLMPK